MATLYNHGTENLKPTAEDFDLERKFWEAIRDDLINTAECECASPFTDIVVSKIKTMGPQALKRLYLDVN